MFPLTPGDGGALLGWIHLSRATSIRWFQKVGAERKRPWLRTGARGAPPAGGISGSRLEVGLLAAALYNSSELELMRIRRSLPHDGAPPEERDAGAIKSALVAGLPGEDGLEHKGPAPRRERGGWGQHSKANQMSCEEFETNRHFYTGGRETNEGRDERGVDRSPL